MNALRKLPHWAKVAFKGIVVLAVAIWGIVAFAALFMIVGVLLGNWGPRDPWLILILAGVVVSYVLLFFVFRRWVEDIDELFAGEERER